jgi:signal transduction histidine kinase
MRQSVLTGAFGGRTAASALVMIVASGILFESRRRISRRRLIQAEERARIATKLHDELLQSLQALILRFDGAAAHMTIPSERARMEDILRLAEDVVVDARSAFGTEKDRVGRR